MHSLLHLRFYRWKPRRVVICQLAGERHELHCGRLQRINRETVLLERHFFAHRETKRKWWQLRWQLYVLRVSCVRGADHPKSEQSIYHFQLERGGLYEFNADGLQRRPSNV